MPFWPFARRVHVEELAPAELQQRLVDAGHTGRAELRRFCEAYRQQIEANVASLVKGPPGLEGDPARLNRFIQGLGNAAQCLANECGSPALWQALTGDSASNPLVRWDAVLQAIPERMQRLEYDALRAELPSLIAETKRFRGDGARQYEAFFNGRLGEICFHSGRAGEAIPFMERALEICRTTGDEQGIAVYLANLAEIARYIGEAERAIALLEQASAQWTRLGQPDRAAATDRSIQRLRLGEPLCRIVCRDDQQFYELDELSTQQNKHYHFEFVRNRPQLQMAITLTEQGGQKAAAGELAAAIELFQAASEVDPYDPQPHYQCGVALMELGAHGAAKESFTEVERLAPGWFRCRFDRWLAEQIEQGELPAEVWTVLRALEDGGLPKNEVEPCCRRALERFPDFAPLWLLLGDCLHARQANAEAEVAYRRGLEVSQEPDVQSRILGALAGILPPQSDERRDLVRRALGLRGSLVAQAVACFILKM